MKFIFFLKYLLKKREVEKRLGSVDKVLQEQTRLKPKKKMIRDETTICDIMPTLANTVIPMARYETVRIQTRRRTPGNAGVTDRTRNDALFQASDPLRKVYATNKNKPDWPVSDLALSGLDAEIHRRVFAVQTGRDEEYDYERDTLKPTEVLRDNKWKIMKDKTGKPIEGITSGSRAAAYEKLLDYAADRRLLLASTGTDVLTGTSWTVGEIDRKMRKTKMMTESVMGYLLRSYLSVAKYDRSVVIDPFVWSTITGDLEKDKPSPFSNAWLAAEVFQYKIPAEALPLGTDASDEILLNQCGISLVIFVLNKLKSHWTLLVYPIRQQHDKRKLYHYDSYGGPRAGLAKIKERTEKPHVYLVKGGLFDKSIFRYLTNPTWTPTITRCHQTDTWSCGYISLGLLDILCRKAERDPASLSNPATTAANMDPLQINDIPKYSESLRRGEHLQKYVVDMLVTAQDWIRNVAEPTVWQIQEPEGHYTNPKGSHKKKIESIVTSKASLGNTKLQIVNSVDSRPWIRAVFH